MDEEGLGRSLASPLVWLALLACHVPEACGAYRVHALSLSLSLARLLGEESLFHAEKTWKDLYTFKRVMTNKLPIAQHKACGSRMQVARASLQQSGTTAAA